MNKKGLFALPYILISIVFVVFPLVLVAIKAFMDFDGNFTLDIVKETFSNPTNIELLGSTIGTALLTTTLCLVISYPIALTLASSDMKKHTVLALLFVVPMWMNFVLRMFAIKEFLNIFGVGNGYFASLVGLVYDFLPFMLLPIYTVLANMDRSFIEASEDLGGNSVKTFMKVTFPLSIPGIISGSTMVFMPVFSAFAITDILGGAGSGLVGSKIEALFKNGLTSEGSALSLMLLFLVFVSMLIVTILNKASKAKLSQGGAKK